MTMNLCRELMNNLAKDTFTPQKIIYYVDEKFQTLRELKN